MFSINIEHSRVGHLWCEADLVRISIRCQRSDALKIRTRQLPILGYDSIHTAITMQCNSTQCDTTQYDVTGQCKGMMLSNSVSLIIY